MALEPCSLLICTGLGLFNTWALARTVHLDHELPKTRTLVLAAPALRGGIDLPWALAGKGGFSCGRKNQKNQEKENSRSRPRTNKNGLKNSWVFCLFQYLERDFIRCHLSVVPVSAGFCRSVFAMHRLFPFIFSPLSYF